MDCKSLPGKQPNGKFPRPEADLQSMQSMISLLMASITIRKLPESTKRKLRIRAARNGHSMEQEARELLEASLAQPSGRSKSFSQ